jgi:hypothetical protein
MPQKWRVTVAVPKREREKIEQAKLDQKIDGPAKRNETQEVLAEKPLDPDALLDEAIEESFPASDPISPGAGTGEPSPSSERSGSGSKKPKPKKG